MTKRFILNVLLISFFLVYTSHTALSLPHAPELEKDAFQAQLAKTIWKHYSDNQKYTTAPPSERLDNPLSNLSTTAPRSNFIMQVDINNEFTPSLLSTHIHYSTNDQLTWATHDTATHLGSEGYETTWQSVLSIEDTNRIWAYLSATIDAGAIGFDYPEIIFTGSPQNHTQDWPPNDSHYVTIVNAAEGNVSSDQDITKVRGTYHAMNDIVDDLYFNMEMATPCCDTGSFWGPWYAYTVILLNPNETRHMIYAATYADGAFGQLTPGLLKINGDISTGEISDFDYLPDDITYMINGNNLHFTFPLDILTDDSDWGEWTSPVLIVLGLTLEITLDLLTPVPTLVDQTVPGIIAYSTIHQEGNTELHLSNPVMDMTNHTFYVDYQDDEGNLPWKKTMDLCLPSTDTCFYTGEMIPESHTYKEGATFYNTVSDETLLAHDTFEVRFSFADDDINNTNSYDTPQLIVPVTTCTPGSGDMNLDGLVNMDDIPLAIDVILNDEYSVCLDVNIDGELDILDLFYLLMTLS
mgnify:CR=1 FL=1